MKTFVPICLVALLAPSLNRVDGQAPAPGGAQGQPPITFKSEVNYVEIDARVTDAQGNFVRDLTQADFRLIEDGQPQALTAFAMVDIPIERPDPPLFAKAAIAPDVVSNRTPFEGRVFVLVIDDLHTKFSDTPRARSAAHQFVERYVGANDMVAVVNTSGVKKTAQDFTSNRQLVLKAIDASMGNKAESSTSARLQDYNQNQISGGASNANASFNEMMRWNNARNSMHMLKSLADFMAGMRGRRKAVVLFSEGVNYDVVDAINNAHATDVRKDMEDAIAAATRANVNIYSVDPRGLVTGTEDAIEIGSFASDNSISSTDLMNELRLENDSLRVLSDETGGFAVLNQNDFRGAFDRILQDNSSYYVLGYHPTNDKRDGRFRNVQVSVAKPGLAVRARKGYVAATAGKKTESAASEKPGATSPELRDALDSPIAMSGLTISAFPVALRGAGGKDAIVMSIEVDGRGLTFATSPQGLFVDDIEMTSFATDVNGKVKDGSHDTLKLNLKPQTHAIVSQSAFRMLRRLQVPPGHYQLRIGVREAGGGRVGTVVYDLDAPDFSKGPLTMSGIAIASGSTSGMPTTNADPAVTEFKDVLPAPPTPARDFPSNDTLAVFAEVYDNVGKTPHRVEITTTIIADDGHEVRKTADERKSDELHGPGGGYGYTTQIPLTGLASGRYVLRVAARHTLSNGDPISRDVEFRVR